MFIGRERPARHTGSTVIYHTALATGLLDRHAKTTGNYDGIETP